jgi:hypothetical protein
VFRRYSQAVHIGLESREELVVLGVEGLGPGDLTRQHLDLDEGDVSDVLSPVARQLRVVIRQVEERDRVERVASPICSMVDQFCSRTCSMTRRRMIGLLDGVK